MIRVFERFNKNANYRPFPLANPDLAFEQGQFFKLGADGKAVLCNTAGEFGLMAIDTKKEVSQNAGMITLATGMGFDLDTNQVDTGQSYAFGVKLKIDVNSKLTPIANGEDAKAVAIALGPLGSDGFLSITVAK